VGVFLPTKHKRINVDIHNKKKKKSTREENKPTKRNRRRYANKNLYSAGRRATGKH
jgi:hypothetical protein